MFYIYEWYKVNTGEIIYVGKGTGNRYKAKKKNKKLNYILANEKCDVRITLKFDSESDAFKAEAKRIAELKEIGQCICNNDMGGVGGSQAVWTQERRKHMSEINPMKREEQKQRMSEHNPMKNSNIAHAVAEKNKRPVIIDGVRYAGTVDAARALNVVPFTVLTWVKRGYNTQGKPCRYEDSEQVNYTWKRHPTEKSVLVDGKRFESVKEAAEYIGCWSESIIRSIKNNRLCKGHKVAYDNQQPSLMNSSKSSEEGSETNG